MATAALSVTPYQQFLDDNGIPLAGCQMFTMVAGSDDYKDSYTDYSGATVQSNPIYADAAGRMQIWLAAGMYKLRLEDANNNIIWTVDNVSGGQTGPTASLVVQTLVGTVSNSLKLLQEAVVGAVTVLGYRVAGDGGGGVFRWADSATGGDDGITVDGYSPYLSGRWVREFEGPLDARWWGAYGDNSQDDRPYFLKAVAYAAANNGTIKLTQGTYKINSSMSFTGVPITFDPKAMFSWTNFSPDMTCIMAPGDISQHFDVGLTVDNVPKFQPGAYVTPFTFGALPDGVTECAYAANQAVSSVTTAGGEVIIPEGTWALTADGIEAKSNVTIKGQGYGSILKALTGFAGGAHIYSSETVPLNNARVTNLAVIGSAYDSNAAIQLFGSNSSIDHCLINNMLHNGVQIGGNVAVDSSNFILADNIINNAAETGVILYNGSGVTLERNTVTAPPTSASVAGILTYPLYHNLTDVVIRDNQLSNLAITVFPESGTKKLTNITIKDNVVRNVSSDADVYGISIAAARSAEGNVVIDSNTVMASGPGVAGIIVAAGAGLDAAQSYTVTNNSVFSSTVGSLGIDLLNLTKPAIITGNAIFGTDSTGIKMTSTTDASYGTNVFSAGVKDWYSGSTNNWCTLGTNFKSQIDGDSTAVGNLSITGNIYNTALTTAYGLLDTLRVTGSSGKSDCTGFNMVSPSNGPITCFARIETNCVSLTDNGGTWQNTASVLVMTINGRSYEQLLGTDSKVVAMNKLIVKMRADTDIASITNYNYDPYLPNAYCNIVFTPKYGIELDIRTDLSRLIAPSSLTYSTTGGNNVGGKIKNRLVTLSVGSYTGGTDSGTRNITGFNTDLCPDINLIVIIPVVKTAGLDPDVGFANIYGAYNANKGIITITQIAGANYRGWEPFVCQYTIKSNKVNGQDYI